MALMWTIYDCEVELDEPMLGTVPKNKEVYTSYIVQKGRELIERDAKKDIPLASGEEATPEAVEARLAEEPETIKEVEERGWTGFHEDEEGPFLYDYFVKAFFKESARTMKEWNPNGEDGDKKNTVKQLQDKVTRYLFVEPRRIRLPKPAEWPNYPTLERPLRAQTAQGPRVTVTRSDLVPAGTKICFVIRVMKGGQITKAMLQDILEYANWQGWGQWRSGGYGRAKLVKLEKRKD